MIDIIKLIKKAIIKWDGVTIHSIEIMKIIKEEATTHYVVRVAMNPKESHEAQNWYQVNLTDDTDTLIVDVERY